MSPAFFMDPDVVIAGFVLIIVATFVICGFCYVHATDRAREREEAIAERDDAVREAAALRAQLYVAGDELADCRAQLTLMSMAAIFTPSDQEK